jgi:hypothetical protein
VGEWKQRIASVVDGDTLASRTGAHNEFAATVGAPSKTLPCLSAPLLLRPHVASPIVAYLDWREIMAAVLPCLCASAHLVFSASRRADLHARELPDRGSERRTARSSVDGEPASSLEYNQLNDWTPSLRHPME